MSKATKRKHVTKEVLDEFILPAENQKIVKVLGGRGNNLHEIETSDGEKYLVSMPTKFRKNVWIKRGNFVVIQPIEEGEKVKAEIFAILYSAQIKYIQDQGKWPKEFCMDKTEETNKESISSSSEISDGSDSDSSSRNSDLFVNTNRPQCAYESSDISDEGSGSHSSSKEN
uniref:Probable RNA-binding protein EIF1AD n=1 Tax=Scapholeberis mucronata TaxID=202097 RepID=A0A4Y7NLE7_9CRUS|nr:EOG090X0KPP [Scapholeberis mucronata]SVE94022.1 EOG090X0KPP [Scapholeberis mucronata]